MKFRCINTLSIPPKLITLVRDIHCFFYDLSFCSFAQELSEKTQSLINNLKGLAVPNEDDTRQVIKLEKLRERKLTSAMENFLYNLAAAEGMV